METEGAGWSGGIGGGGGRGANKLKERCTSDSTQRRGVGGSLEAGQRHGDIDGGILRWTQGEQITDRREVAVSCASRSAGTNRNETIKDTEADGDACCWWGAQV